MTGPSRMHERLLALLILGVAVLTPPILTMFNSPGRLLGIPALYIYLFFVWLALIGLVALVVERDGGPDEVADAAPKAPAGEARQPRGEPGDA